MYTKITISGQICSGKSSLFHYLHDKLGWPTFSTSQLFRQRAGQQKSLLESADEQNARLTKEVDNEIRTQLLTHPNMIVEGWMSGIMAADVPGVLRIFLKCRDEVRFARFAQREGVSLEQAKERVVAREENWLAKLEEIYQRRDFFDPKYFNLIIDTSDLTPEQVNARVLKHVSIT